MKKRKGDEKELRYKAKKADRPKAENRNRTQEAVQGFFLPQSYKLSIQWKVNPIFRATFLILLLTLLYAVLLIPRWIFTQEWKKAAIDLTKTSLDENEWVAAALAKIRPIRNKYQEIGRILQYRRIALAPILSSIQRHIPKEISLRSFQWESDLNKTTDNILIVGRRTKPPVEVSPTSRKATLKMEIYATPKWNREKSPAGWLANVESDLKKNGIKVTERNIGTEQPFIPIGQPEEQNSGVGASTIEITLQLELDGPQEKRGSTTRDMPKKAEPNPTSAIPQRQHNN